MTDQLPTNDQPLLEDEVRRQREALVGLREEVRRLESLAAERGMLIRKLEHELEEASARASDFQFARRTLLHRIERSRRKASRLETDLETTQAELHRVSGEGHMAQLRAQSAEARLEDSSARLVAVEGKLARTEERARRLEAYALDLQSSRQNSAREAAEPQAEAQGSQQNSRFSAMRRKTLGRLRSPPAPQIHPPESTDPHLERQKARIAESGLFDEPFYREQAGELLDEGTDALEHYIRSGALLDHDPHPLFDNATYRLELPELVEERTAPLAHYLDGGWKHGIEPHALFDTEYYLEQHPDAANGELTPLEHYLRIGSIEGTDPTPSFDSDFYLSHSEDAREAGWNPLVHYVRIGKGEGRACVPAEGAERARDFDAWLAVNRPNARTRAHLSARMARVALPKISILMRVENPNRAFFDRALESVFDQFNPAWELVIIDESNEDGRIRSRLDEMLDERVVVEHRAPLGGLAGAINRAAERASGDAFVLLGAEDQLDPNALAELACALADDPECDFAYADDCAVDEAGHLEKPRFKPDWSPELLLSFFYCGRPFAIRRALFAELGGLRLGFDGAEDHDLVLRATEVLRKATHVPKLLYHFRRGSSSEPCSSEAERSAMEAGRRSVREALQRRGRTAWVQRPAWAQLEHRQFFQHDFEDHGPSVTILIPTKNAVGLVTTCLDSIEKTTYQNFEVHVIDNDSDDPKLAEELEKRGVASTRVQSPPEGFSFAHVCNRGAEATSADYLLFLNNDVEVIDPRWLSKMMGLAQLEGVGSVGAKLLYPDGRVQHAGVGLGYFQGMAGHAFKLAQPGDRGPLTLVDAVRNTAAVTGACLLTPRDLFGELGGFDERRFSVAYNDVDYGLRILDHGLRNVQCGAATLIHAEGASRGFIDRPSEVAAFRQLNEHRNDPFLSPYLDRNEERHELLPRHVVLGDPARRRALFVTHDLEDSGAARILFETVVGLREKGALEPTVLCCAGGAMESRYAEAGIEVRQDAKLTGGLQGHPTALDAAVQHVRTLAPDLVVASGLTAWYAIEGAEHHETPSVWLLQEPEPHLTGSLEPDSAVRRRFLEAFTFPYRVVLGTETVRANYAHLINAHNIEIVSPGVPRAPIDAAIEATSRNASRHRLGLEDDAFVLLHIGQANEKKAQLDLLEAVTGMRESLLERVRLVLAGSLESEYGRNILETYEALRPAARRSIRLLGRTDSTDDLFAAADLFVNPSRVEGYPLVILEAMAWGLPILATPTMGVAQQVSRSVNGDWTIPADIRNLRKSITRLATDRDRLERYASASRAAFESRPSFERMLLRYETIFTEAYFSKPGMVTS